MKIERDMVILLILVTCASVFSIVTVVQTNAGPTILQPSVFNIAHVVIEIFAISVCLSIFGIRLSSGSITKDSHSLILGATFLTVGLLQLFHLLSYPGMTTSLSLAPFDATTYFWIFSRFTMIVPMLFVVTIPIKSTVNIYDTIISILAAFLYSFLLLLIVLIYGTSLPPLFFTDGGVSWFDRAAEYGIVLLFIAGIIRYWRLGKVHNELTNVYLSIALLLGVFGELSFSLFGNEFGLINLMGHMFVFFSFLFVFLALLRESVIIPVNGLRLTKKQLEREHQALLESYRKLELKTKQIEKAESRAEAYFDFLAHDIANIISPIMVYSEMISPNQEIPEETRTEANIIRDLCRRANSFIRNLRRLEDIEKFHPDEIGSMDLKRFLSTMESEIRNELKEKKFRINYDIPALDRINIKGGQWIEGVVRDIVDNAIRYSPSDSRIDVRICPIDNLEKSFWQIEISDSGTGLRNELKGYLTNTMSSSKKEYKGVASSLPFCASIIKYLGGDLTVEDRFPGNPNDGINVIIKMPRDS